MAVKPKIKIKIAGKPVDNYVEMELDQDIYDHHYFRIVIKHDDIEELGAHKLDKSMDWLGKSVLIDMEKCDFAGIVTSVDMVHSHNHFGDIVVSGYSKTIMLETAPHKHSWLKKTLKEVVSTLGQAGSDLTIINTPKYTETIDYLAQYDESHFDFLKRLSITYGEWLYYDGANLVFGEPKSMPTIPLVFGKDADNIKIGINIKNVKYERVSYHSKRKEAMGGATQNSVSGLDDLGGHAFSVAQKVFNFKGRSHTTTRIPNKGSLDDYLKKTQAASAADLSVVEGRSKQRGIRPGAIIELTSEAKKNGKFPSRTYGSYLVISTKHYSSSACNYANVFKAIPAGVKVLPTPKVKNPQVYPELAKVISNEDPDGKGRVQVQTQWQDAAEGLSTGWVRVMSPNAGNSGAVSTNRGFMFVPEPDDEVILGYRYGDPSRPFVMGSVYNGMTGAGGDTNNRIKSITTRTGSTITFDDDEGDGMITISDPSGNTVVMDGAGGISMTAPKTIAISAGESISISSPEVVMHGSKNVAVVAGEELNMSGKTTGVGASDSLTVQGGTVGVMGTGTAGKVTIESLAVSVNGVQTTHIQGGLVNIN